MQKYFVTLFLSLSLFFTAFNACALPMPFIDVDAFSYGDKKAVRDTNTNLEWLDFGVNNNKSFNEVVAALDTTYVGWRLPTESEAKNLWEDFFSPLRIYENGVQIDGWFSDIWGVGYGGINIWNSQSYKYVPLYEEHFAEIENIFGLNFNGYLTYEFNQQQGLKASQGLFLKDDGSFGIASWEHMLDVNMSPRADVYRDFVISPDYKEEMLSTLLVRKVGVAEPGSMILAVLGLTIMLLRRYLVNIRVN